MGTSSACTSITETAGEGMDAAFVVLGSDPHAERSASGRIRIARFQNRFIVSIVLLFEMQPRSDWMLRNVTNATRAKLHTLRRSAEGSSFVAAVKRSSRLLAAQGGHRRDARAPP